MHVELLDEFPEIVGYNDSFVCHDCDACSKLFPGKQNVMCDACAEISTFLSCDVNDISNVENDSIVEDVNHDVNVSDSIDFMGYDDFVLQDCAQISGDVASNLVELNSVPRLIPSIAQPSNVELKPLPPEHLKYAFLEDNEKLSFILAKNLPHGQEEKLLHVSKQRKKDVSWKRTRWKKSTYKRPST
ncbi:hypothetical protein QL285_082435 [Trifolium repens]|nr:hypothetical protein QL285_082434 [Trifolium repens]KAK2369290.1 hypothetical protein QL285_082435 [Trifolium repens]